MVGESHARRTLDAFGFLKDMTCSYIFQGFKPLLSHAKLIGNLDSWPDGPPGSKHTSLPVCDCCVLHTDGLSTPQVGEGHPEGPRDSFPAVIFFSEPCVV